jgi:hypothetical protein
MMYIPTEARRPVMYGRYFQVVKNSSIVYTGGSISFALDRAIYSAVLQNKLATDPPSFSLASIEQIRQGLLAFPKCYVALGDWRHFFYQFRLPKVATRFFGVHLSNPDRHLAQNVLPMGFNWAPASAQAAAVTAWWKAIRD